MSKRQCVRGSISLAVHVPRWTKENPQIAPDTTRPTPSPHQLRFPPASGSPPPRYLPPAAAVVLRPLFPRPPSLPVGNPMTMMSPPPLEVRASSYSPIPPRSPRLVAPGGKGTRADQRSPGLVDSLCAAPDLTPSACSYSFPLAAAAGGRRNARAAPGTPRCRLPTADGR
jgi:hypothetical protein